MKSQFCLTDDHLKLLAHAYWEWSETGPAFDCKRPFGDKDIEQDMARLLNWATPMIDGEPRITDGQRARLRELFTELLTAIEIVLQHAVHPYNGAKPGIYHNTASKYARCVWERLSKDKV